MPHHVIQRGNRRQKTFFHDSDYRFYAVLLRHWCRKFEVEIWAYCLMPNHVHLILVPHKVDSLSLVMSEVHRRYTQYINKREGWTGFLWQGRYSSYPMDERHLLCAARYIELNPVEAGIVATAEQYAWSSAQEHLGMRQPHVCDVSALLQRVPDWSDFLQVASDAPTRKMIQSHVRSGHPAGSEDFVDALERLLGRRLKPGKRGPKSKAADLRTVDQFRTCP
jgi:putative transposase